MNDPGRAAGPAPGPCRWSHVKENAMKGLRWTYAVAPVAAVLLAAAVVMNTGRTASAEDADTSSLEGKQAPDFTLQTIDGKTVKLADLKGDVVMLDFWATWCPPCRKGLPHVQALSQKKELTDKGLKVFAVNVQEKNEQVEAFLKKNNYTFTVPMDKEGKASEAYLVTGIPTTVIIGRDGKIKRALVGLVPPDELDKAIQSALNEKAPAA